MTDVNWSHLAALAAIAAEFDTTPDPHGLISIAAEGEGRYVLVDRDVEFRVGLYGRDHDLALVMVEVPTVADAVAAARTLSEFWIEVAP